MIAIWGGLLLLVGGGLLGYGVTAQLGRRIEGVRALREQLYQMERSITLYFTPLPELLCQREGVFAQSLSTCGRQLEEGISLAICWDSLVDNLPIIGGEERSLLRPLGQILGRFEGEVQSAALLRTAQQLGQLEERLVEERRRLGRLYPTVGVTAGAFLAILLG